MGMRLLCIPGKSMVFKNESCKNAYRAKDRVTLMLCCNMSISEILKPLLIGYSWKPRCFKHVKSLPVGYHFNKTVWMTKISNRWKKSWKVLENPKKLTSR